MNWKELAEKKVFKKAYMDAVINEFPEPTNAFLITKAFMPMKNVNDERLIALRKNGMFGKTNPVETDGEHATITLPGGIYLEANAGEWREAVKFSASDFKKIRHPEKPNDLWGQDMIGESLNFLDLRLNTRIEQLSADTVFKKGYSIAAHGVNYTYSTPIPPKYYIQLGDTAATGWALAPWRAAPNNNQKWSDLTNSDPLLDIRELTKFASDWGMNLKAIYMNSTTAGYVEDNANVKTLWQASPELAGKLLTVKLLVNSVAGLKGIGVIVDDRVYLEETQFTAAATAGDNTITVQDSGEFSLGDTITLRNTTNNEEDIKIHSSTPIDTSTPGAHVITLAANIVNSFLVGSRVTKAVHYVPNDTIAFKADVNIRTAPSNWISIPSVYKTGNILKPAPGRFTWKFFKVDRPPYWAEVGAGIEGGPVVWGSGGWVTMKVA